MRVLREGKLIRFFRHHTEVVYIVLGVSGVQAEIEFPSDWHETRAAWVRLGFGLCKVAFSFPYSKAVPDEYQCSGPTYGFNFFADNLHLHWGKCKGKRGDPIKLIQMPWGWRFINHKILSDPETYTYRYTLKSGEVQKRNATIFAEERSWWRPWFPFYKRVKSIDVQFDGEVGEKSGSWKGGVIGCGYEMEEGELPFQTLCRMEFERKM